MWHGPPGKNTQGRGHDDGDDDDGDDDGDDGNDDGDDDDDDGDGDGDDDDDADGDDAWCMITLSSPPNPLTYLRYSRLQLPRLRQHSPVRSRGRLLNGLGHVD